MLHQPGFQITVNKCRLLDLSDRLHYVLCFNIIGFVTVLIGGGQIFGDPIHCLAEQESRKIWVSYYNEYCFIQQKYMKPENVFDSTLSTLTVGYYQYIPYCLVLQMFLFLIPWLFWKLCCPLDFSIKLSFIMDNKLCVRVERRGVEFICAGLPVDKDKKKIPSDDSVKADREKYNYLTLVKQAIKSAKSRYCFFWPGAKHNFALVMYTLCKFLQLVNLYLQFCVLYFFVGRQQSFWGFSLMSDLINGNLHDEKNVYFPRVLYCEVPKWEMGGNRHIHRLECLLTINFLNEKAFLFLYFMFIVLTVFTIFTLLHYLGMLFLPAYRFYTMKIYIPSMEAVFPKEFSDMSEQTRQKLQRHLVEKILGGNGCLLVKSTGFLRGVPFARNLVQQLWIAEIDAEDKDRGFFGNFGLKPQSLSVTDKPETDKSSGYHPTLHDALSPSAPSFSSDEGFSTLKAHPEMQRGRVGFMDNHDHNGRLYAGKEEPSPGSNVPEDVLSRDSHSSSEEDVTEGQKKKKLTPEEEAQLSHSSV